GVTSKIHKSMDWMKGTEWMWNDWEKVRFQSDGIFVAPTEECHQPQAKQCKWSADKDGKIYIMWGKKSGLHEVKADHMPDMNDDDFELELPNISLSGKRKRDGAPLHAEFVQVFDTEIQDARRDLYGDLGLEPGADVSTVKKAFRKMSIKYHPDKTGNDPTAHRKFTRIGEANEILSDPAKKFLYDMGGMESVRAMEKGDIPRGEDGHVTYPVPLEKLYTGSKEHVRINRRVVCTGCRQKPDLEKCRGCGKCPDEVKMVQQQVGPGFFVQQQQQVPSRERCKNEDTELELNIEKGMMDGEQIVFEGMAEQRPGQIPGNLIFTIKQTSDQRFTRENGYDLRTATQIPLKEALLGFDRSMAHLDGHQVRLVKQPGEVCQPFEVMKIPGEGMPHKVEGGGHSDYGDLYVKMNVKFPESLTDAQREAIDKLFPAEETQ
ncbi:hypothetical protein FOZ62_022559, partial [Perkinsus olseni]